MGTNGVQHYANELKPLVQRFGGADHQIVFQCVEVLKYLIQHDREKYFNSFQLKMSDFWHYAIHTANKKGKIDVTEFKAFISKIMTTSAGSVIVEQAFSTFFYTKNNRRSRLSTTSLHDIMSIMSNGVEPESFDPMPYVAQWLAEGRHESYDATMVDETGLVTAPQTPIERFLEENQDIEQINLEDDDEPDDSDLIAETEDQAFEVFIDEISEDDPIFPDEHI